MELLGAVAREEVAIADCKSAFSQENFMVGVPPFFFSYFPKGKERIFKNLVAVVVGGVKMVEKW